MALNVSNSNSLGQELSKTRDNLPELGQPTHTGRPTGHWDGPLGVGQLASKWDDPQLGQPSQTGTPQPKWDNPAKLGQPTHVGRPTSRGTSQPPGASHERVG